MFSLIATGALFMLGIAFLAFGKDDFGITISKDDTKNNPKQRLEQLTFDTLTEQ